MDAKRVFYHMSPSMLAGFVADIDKKGANAGSWENDEISMMAFAIDALIANVGLDAAGTALADAGVINNPIVEIIFQEGTL